MAIEPAHDLPAAAHHIETAARHLARQVPVARGSETATAVLQRLQGVSYDYAGAVYLTDPQGRLEGIVPMNRLLAAGSGQTLDAIARPAPPTVTPDSDQEHAASLAIHEEIAAVPVVDAQHRLLGVIPPQALIEILRREHVEDLHRLAGITRENVRARHAIEAPPARRARDRLPWLVAGLGGSIVATFVVAHFEHALNSQIAIAFFIPGIVYLADAIGTQTEAIAVRGISLSRVSILSLVLSEIRTGLIIGSTLAVLAFFPVWWWFDAPRLALAVALALLTAGVVATSVGILLPWLLSRLGRDPAFGSGPIATILQDVLSLLIYFAMISLLVL
jgi:magnesium transporter